MQLKCKNQYYIDKTERLEKGIEIFPSIYIEGAAASGKTTAVQMLLFNHPDVKPLFFFMDEESKDTETFLKKLDEAKCRMKSEKVWMIFENMSNRISKEIITEMVRLVELLPEDGRVFFLGRERMEEEFLSLLWKRKMELFPQNLLLFTKEEVRQLVDMQGSPLSAEELYEETGGWAGCVDLMIRLSVQKAGNGRQESVKELRGCYETAAYIQREIIDTLSEEEQKMMHYAAICPWLNIEVCSNISGMPLAEKYLESLERKGLLLCDRKNRRWKIAPVFRGNYTEVMNHQKGSSMESCFLRGLHCYLQQNFAGVRKEIQKLNPENGKREKEIFLNLSYLNPSLALDDWLGLLEKYADEKNKIRLFSILGNSHMYLCGLRDLSGLFACEKKEENRKAKIWRKYLGESEWIVYRLARMEYYMETERKDKISEEDWWLFRQSSGERPWQAFLAGSLYAEQGYETEKLTKWLRYSEISGELNVTEENYMMFFYKAKGFLLLNQYEKAEKLLEHLIPYLQLYRRSRLLAEAFFQHAIVNWRRKRHPQAMKNMIESFVVNGSSRYVDFYTGYGKTGVEVMEAYVEWLKQQSPEGWHRKKKYNYGNVLRMPLADYMETLLRCMRREERRTPAFGEQPVEERLTMMETIVLQNIGRGMSNAAMCTELNLKLTTVKSHVYSLYKKLGVNSRVQAVVKGKELGIIK